MEAAEGVEAKGLEGILEGAERGRFTAKVAGAEGTLEGAGVGLEGAEGILEEEGVDLR